MGSFKMNVQNSKKIFDVMVGGSFSETDAKSFINEYNQQVKAFNAKEFNIELDCTTLVVTNPNVLPLLEQCYLMYTATGFKRIIFKIKSNPVLQMQLSRVARNTGLSNYEIVQV